MEGQDQGDELYPIAVLIDELKVRTSGVLLDIFHSIMNPRTDTRHSMTTSFFA